MWQEWLISHESAVRLSVFVGVLLLMLSWESRAPWRALTQARLSRWFSHGCLTAINTLSLRLFVPIAAVALAELSDANQWGLLNWWPLSESIAIILAIVVLDLVIYWQHRLFHLWPWLWRLHKVHHADLDYDTTTAVRFHPLEILLSMLIKLSAVVVLGVPPVSVVIFEILLNACAMFNHGNVRLPEVIERPLRWLIVTPNMHRVHHSIELKESNTNFGFCLSVWDRLFRSYQSHPGGGYKKLVFGLKEVQETQRAVPLISLLLLPFKR